MAYVAHQTEDAPPYQEAVTPVCVCRDMRCTPNGERFALSRAVTPVCVCRCTRKPWNTARRCCFPTQSDQSRMPWHTQDVHGNRNSNPSSHTPHRGIEEPKLLPLSSQTSLRTSAMSPHMSPQYPPFQVSVYHSMQSGKMARHAVKPLEPRGFRLDNKKPRGVDSTGYCGQGEIRTRGGLHHNGFQDRLHRPLGHLSMRLRAQTVSLPRGLHQTADQRKHTCTIRVQTPIKRKAQASHLRGSMTSLPPMYGRMAFGISMEPSAC